MTEREIQRLAVQRIRENGFLVTLTSNRRATANTVGTPDCAVYVGHGYWIQLDFKSSNGRLSERQKELQALGAVHFPRSADEAVRTCIDEKHILLLRL